MGVAGDRATVELDPERAFGLWADVRRWPTFVDGFARPERLDDSWPEEGAKLVWQSTPDGRGRVTERVTACEPGRLLVTEVFEERLTGSQRVAFEPHELQGTVVHIELEYALVQGGLLAGVTDALFIRRAIRDSLSRTLRRFATEAAEEAAL
ncbi:MAG TPA: SRPBCC family protein [Thermoleophilaceae bacterium]|jgi:uncharacterized membrane protein